jgi:hypothetical protein
MQIAEFFEQTVLSAGRVSPQRVLCHYTTSSGARNILSSQEFWSTAHDCTNDEAELASANSIVAEVARACRRQNATETVAKVLGVFLANYPDSVITQMRTVYLSCFSAARDDERQWREYGESGRGICLGIRVLEEPGPQNTDLVSVTFEVDCSETLLRHWLAETFGKICSVLARVLLRLRATRPASSPRSAHRQLAKLFGICPSPSELTESSSHSTRLLLGESKHGGGARTIEDSTGS